jgi:hypothetical protein
MPDVHASTITTPATKPCRRVPIARLLLAIAIPIVGLALAAAGVYIGETDDAPGAALLGFLLMAGSIAAAIRLLRRGHEQFRMAASEDNDATIVHQTQNKVFPRKN